LWILFFVIAITQNPLSSDGISISYNSPVVNPFSEKIFSKKCKKGVDGFSRSCYNTGTVEDTPERGERLDRLTRSPPAS
jgi:hypothetical protein